jgi:hypothetical protein
VDRVERVLGEDRERRLEHCGGFWLTGQSGAAAGKPHGWSAHSRLACASDDRKPG